MPDGFAYNAGSRKRGTWRVAPRFQNEMGVCFFGIWVAVNPVIPAQAGIFLSSGSRKREIPACAGMTGGAGMTGLSGTCGWPAQKFKIEFPAFRGQTGFRWGLVWKMHCSARQTDHRCAIMFGDFQGEQ
jgi:hypothetical protein